MSFFAELKKRRVIRAALLYAVPAWVVIQVADTVLPRLGAPDWTVTFIILLATFGFPVILILAWLYDVTPDGVRRAGPTASAPRAIGLIGLGMVITLVVFGAYWRLQPAGRASKDVSENSVAVLPFTDLSQNKDQEYFADGITEEILNGLSQLPDLRVPARTSSFSFKGKNLPVRDIANQLSVAHVLEGSVRKAGDKVRITAQLIDARSDEHLWSQTYDRDLDDVFAVQSEIARAIVSALQLRMSPSAGQLVEQETANGTAHEAYLKGLYYWHRRHADELPMSLEYFQAAVRADPRYARAHAGVALAYAVVPQYYTLRADDRRTEQPITLSTAIREGKAAAARALQLDPKAADAHAALGQIAQEFEWDWKSAERHLDEALRLDPNYATAHQWRAELYLVLGRFDDALAEIDRALALDPLSSVMMNNRALMLHKLGRDNDAIAQLQALMQDDPGFATARQNLFGIMLGSGRYEELRRLAGTDSVALLLADGVQFPGKRPAMLQVLGAQQFRSQVTHAQLAIAYALAEQPDSAATILLRGTRMWEPQIAYWVHDPWTRSLQDQPQFKAYRARVGL